MYWNEIVQSDGQGQGHRLNQSTGDWRPSMRWLGSFNVQNDLCLFFRRGVFQCRGNWVVEWGRFLSSGVGGFLTSGSPPKKASEEGRPKVFWKQKSLTTDTPDTSVTANDTVVPALFEPAVCLHFVGILWGFELCRSFYIVRSGFCSGFETSRFEFYGCHCTPQGYETLQMGQHQAKLRSAA